MDRTGVNLNIHGATVDEISSAVNQAFSNLNSHLKNPDKQMRLMRGQRELIEADLDEFAEL